MARNVFIIICYLICCSSVYSQTDNESNEGFYYLDNGEIQSLTTLEAKLKFVLNNEFSRLISGGTINGIGNYASFNTSNNTLAASLNLVGEHGIFDINLSGGASDGVSNLFTNDTFNPKISISAAYHFLVGDKKIELNYADVQIMERKYTELISKKELDLANVEAYKYSMNKALVAKKNALAAIEKQLNPIPPTQDQIAIYEKQIRLLDGEIKSIKSKKIYYDNNLQSILQKLRETRDDPSNSDIFKNEKFIVDSLEALAYEYKFNENIKIKNAERKKLQDLLTTNQQDINIEAYKAQHKLIQKEIKQLEDKIADYDVNLPTIKGLIRNKIDDEVTDNIKKANDIKATDISLSWFTLGGGLKYEEFTLFDETRAIDNQVYNQTDQVPSIFAAFSHYEHGDRQNSTLIDAKRVHFFTAGFNLKIDNNGGALKSRELKTTDSLSPGRTLIKSQDVLIGDFDKNSLSSQIYGDFYKFVGTKNNVGFHVRGTLDLGEFKPVTSMRFGFLFPLMDKDKKGSFLNLELFFGLNDIFEEAEDESFFNRNVLGIQATVPFNFKIF